MFQNVLPLRHLGSPARQTGAQCSMIRQREPRKGSSTLKIVISQVEMLNDNGFLA